MHCAAAAAVTTTSASSLALRCNPGERKVWVERGEGAARKIVFSSTFDSVLDASAHGGADDESRIYDAALAPAVAGAMDGKLGVVLCVGSEASKANRSPSQLPGGQPGS